MLKKFVNVKLAAYLCAMSLSAVKMLTSNMEKELIQFPYISKNASQKKVIEFISRCKYIVICACNIYVVNFDIYCKAESIFENWIDIQLKNLNK